MTKIELTELITRLEHDLNVAESTHDIYIGELNHYLEKVAVVKATIEKHDKSMVEIGRDLINAYDQLQAMEGKT